MRSTKLLCCLICSAAVTSAHAAAPSDDIVDACLHGKTEASAKRFEIATNEVTADEDFLGNYKATLFKVNGRNVGYAEKEGQAGLVWGGSVTPLKRAISLDRPSSDPSDFSPLLADWSLIRKGAQRFLCVNFNFDGLGRSGSFQNVHGLYLLQIPKKKDGKPSLFYSVRAR